MTALERLTISVSEAAEMSGIGRDTLYNLCHTEGFPVIRIGPRRVRIHRERFVQWVDAQIQQTANQPARPS